MFYQLQPLQPLKGGLLYQLDVGQQAAICCATIDKDGPFQFLNFTGVAFNVN